MVDFKPLDFNRSANNSCCVRPFPERPREDDGLKFFDFARKAHDTTIIIIGGNNNAPISIQPPAAPGDKPAQPGIGDNQDPTNVQPTDEPSTQPVQPGDENETPAGPENGPQNPDSPDPGSLNGCPNRKPPMSDKDIIKVLLAIIMQMLKNQQRERNPYPLLMGNGEVPDNSLLASLNGDGNDNPRLASLQAGKGQSRFEQQSGLRTAM